MDQATHAQLARAARQQLETIRLLGVDFVPIGNAPSIETSDEVRQAALAGQTGAAGVSNDGPKGDRLAALCKLHETTCPHCVHAVGFTNMVFGEGNPDADLMFIGEAPGAEEDRTGRPFVGRAGKKLDEIIHAMKLKRADVYIANVLKTRPPNNRTPLPDEVGKCSPFLAQQIDIIQPKVIVTLGGPATKLILRSDQGITRIRGIWGSYSTGNIEVPVMPTFHPAYLLRNYTKDTRAKVWSDMQAVMERLAE